ncbi:MAG: hypothetical protein KGJ33_03415 [Patescibacteria group bacterium]|nr:hypothetical protein [Patescibacteria group bacterium]
MEENQGAAASAGKNNQQTAVSLDQQLREQRELLEKIYASAEKTRKYFLWTTWATLITFVLPLVALAFVIPYFLSQYTSYLSGSGLGL